MYTIVTKHTSNDNGAGRVVATTVAAGKRRQATVPWDHAASSDRNHGNAAGVLAQRVGLEWHDGITHEVNDDGRHAFVWSPGVLLDLTRASIK